MRAIFDKILSVNVTRGGFSLNPPMIKTRAAVAGLAFWKVELSGLGWTRDVILRIASCRVSFKGSALRYVGKLG